MFSKILLLASLAVTAVFADPVPSAPGPGDVYNQGSQCKIEWTPDTTGAWKTMNIELMTGANLNMKHLTTVTTVDGTTTSSYSWTCPGVVPNSAIYFYQFTSPASNTTLWTTRFGIASTDGHLDPPSESTQPGSGDAIPWGNGALADPSSATPPPSGVNTNSTSSGGVAVSGSASAAASGVSVTPTQSVVSLSSTPAAAASGFATSSGSARASGATGSGSAAAASGSKSSASASPSGGAAAANAAVGGVEGGLVKVAVALAGVGAAFAVVL